jgi:hypothetical protein
LFRKRNKIKNNISIYLLFNSLETILVFDD